MPHTALSKFRQFHIKKVSEKPKLFEMQPPDPGATEQELLALERLLAIQLPTDYRQFLKEFGGGPFGLTNIFSANVNSEFYAGKWSLEARSLVPEQFLAFSDDFCGGWYLLPVLPSEDEGKVFYWHYEEGLAQTEMKNIFDFVAKFAYDGI